MNKLAALAVLLTLLVACSDEPLRDDRIVLNVSVGTRHYPVSGTTTETIFDSLGQSRLRDSDGAQAVGLTSAALTYDWESADRNGDCVIGSMTLTLDLYMTLPQHVQEASLPPEVRAKWAQYAQGVQDHEQRHVDIYSDGGAVVRGAMLEIPAQDSCQEMDAEIARVWAAHYQVIDDRQDEFHAQEDARLDALRQPVKQRLETAAQRLTFLAQEIDRYGRSIGTIESQISAVDLSIDNLKARIDGLERLYPNGAPPGILSQYQSLVDEHNGLVLRFNRLIGEGNDAVRRRNDLAREHDGLIEEMKPLTQEYEWLR